MPNRSIDRRQFLKMAGLFTLGTDSACAAGMKDASKTEAQWEVFNNIITEECRTPVVHAIGNHDIWGWGLADGQFQNDPQYGKVMAIEKLGLSGRLDNMLRSLVGKLNSMQVALATARKKFPAEEVLFASAATILETKLDSPVGWSFQRLFQRRGHVVLTSGHILLKSSFLSYYTVIYLGITLIFLFNYYRTAEPGNLLIVFLMGIFIYQRLPYQKEIRLEEIQNVRVGLVRGVSGRGNLITLYLEEKTIDVIPTRMFPEDIDRLILKK